MRSRGARVKLIPAVQKEEYFIQIVIFKQKMLEDFTFPSVTEILIEKIDQKGDFLLILHRLSPELYLACFRMDLVFLDKSNHKLRKAGIIFI